MGISGAFFLFIYLIPLIFIFYRLRNRIRSSVNIAKDIELTRTYGFLTMGYKLTGEHCYYYWDFVIMIRDFLISLVTTVFDGSTDEIRLFQIKLLLLIYFVSLVLQIHHKPYITENLNNLEFYTLIVGMFTLSLGLLVRTSVFPLISKIAQIILIVVIVWFFFWWFCKFYWELVAKQ